jgi:ATP-dependent DNA ligase
MIDYFTSEPMKYFAPSSTMSPDARRAKLEQMIDSGNYLFGEKTDGNWSRAVITPERTALQTRGISTVTKTYGEIQDKVLFWDNVCNAFNKGTTVILGEVYLPGAIDKDVGSILRSLTPKALSRQKDHPLRWRIFDVLALDGFDCMTVHFEQRIKMINEVVNRINSPLVEGVTYQEMDDTFFDKMGEIFAAGGEGCVCYKKDSIYIPGKRGPHAWDTVKVKQEISSEIDCVIMGTVAGEKIYTGKDMGSWTLWENQRTGELLEGEYFGEYQNGGAYIPVTKNYFHGWPAAIQVGVYNKEGQLIPLCKVSGLTEDFKSELRDHPADWIGVPVSISGMMVSEAKASANGEGISVRHPLLKRIRKDDIDPKDCTLAKIYN